MAVFTATHGVKFTDDDGDWAHFVLDEESTELVEGVTVKVYRFATKNTKVIGRLRKVKGWGITEVKDAPEPEPAPEPVAAPEPELPVVPEAVPDK